MATECTREWIKFFTGCGIPDDVATMYALVFYENRIQKNMLMDLNKEYLRDMGITVMGDVIAILRYAKLVHKKQVREQILLEDDDLSVDQNTESSLVPKPPSVKRMLEHYNRKYNSPVVEKPKEVQLTITNERNSGTNLEMPAKFLPKKKVDIQPQKMGTNEKNVKLAPPLNLRKILPEKQKGDCEIKMPLGTTERSKKILEQAKKREAKTVFDRLGESSVSSTTSDFSSSNSISTNSTSCSLAAVKNPSVFSRLGEKTSIVSSTSSGDQSERVYNERLPYVGILKTEATQKKFFPTVTMRADDEEQKSIIGKTTKESDKGIKTRLGLSINEVQRAKAPIRVETSSQRRENVAKPLLGKIKNVIESNSNASVSNNKMANVVKNRLMKQTVEGKAIVSESQIQSTRTGINLKRKLGSCGEVASKKVRFGTTTLRLIPPSSPSSSPLNSTDESKTYPKLMMIVSNRTTIPGKVPQSESNSDRTRQKISLAPSSAIKSFRERIEKRRGQVISAQGSPPKKFCSIRDRLG